MGSSLEQLTDVQQHRLNAELALLDEARSAIVRATTVTEVKEIANRAEALEVYAKRAEYGDLLAEHALQIKLRAERKGGKLLAEMDLSKGGAGHHKSQVQSETQVGSHDSPVSSAPSLGDLGLSKDQSKKWQRIATIPDDEFEKVIEEVKSERELLKIARDLEKLAEPEPEPEPFTPEAISEPEPEPEPVEPMMTKEPWVTEAAEAAEAVCGGYTAFDGVDWEERLGILEEVVWSAQGPIRADEREKLREKIALKKLNHGGSWNAAIDSVLKLLDS